MCSGEYWFSVARPISGFDSCSRLFGENKMISKLVIERTTNGWVVKEQYCPGQTRIAGPWERKLVYQNTLHLESHLRELLGEYIEMERKPDPQ